MEENFISQYQATGFYLNLESHTYGVCINIKDIDRADEIKQQIMADRKEQIESWKKMWQEQENEEVLVNE